MLGRLLCALGRHKATPGAPFDNPSWRFTCARCKTTARPSRISHDGGGAPIVYSPKGWS